MSRDASTPGLTEVYRLGEQLEQDGSISLTDLRHRDRAIGARCEATDDTGLLLFWLGQVDTGQASADAAAQRRTSMASALLLVRCLAFVLGFLAMLNFLFLGGPAAINIFFFLIVFVLLQALLCVLSGFIMAASLRGNPPAILPVNPARFVLKKAFPDMRYFRESQAVVRLLLLRYGQEIGALFTLGAFAGSCVVPISQKFSFFWSTTMGKVVDPVASLFGALSSPWSAWVPGAAPTFAQVEASWFDPAGGAFAQSPDHSIVWWFFLALCMLCYALIPRIALWVLSRSMYTRLMHRAFTDYPGCQAVLSRMKAPLVKTQAEVAEDPGGTGKVEEVSLSLDDGLVLLVWAGVLEEASQTNFLETRPVPPGNIYPAGLGSLQDDQLSAEKVSAYKPERLLVAVKSWEPPMADLSDFLGGLASVPRCTLCLVPLPGHTVTNHNLQEWSDFARELPLEAVDVQPLTSV